MNPKYFLLVLLTFISISFVCYAQQEERSTQPQLIRDSSLFPLQSTDIWTEVHPLIPRVIYWGVHFVNADTGWAVGEGGAIIKTTNGGEKWIWYESGVENTLKTVSAINNGQRVIAAGDGGIILISEDAGETWNPLPSGTTDNIWNMQMITNEIGWMVGEGATALKTNDGGLTWLQQTVPHTSLAYWDVSFVDTSFGYICCNSAIVLKTTNGGADWQIQQAGDTRSLFTIYAFDSLRASAGGFAGKVVYTTDGGSNWINVTGASVEVNKIKFINATKGFLASTSGFYKSTNGGVDWFSISDLTQASTAAFTTNLSFPTGTKGFVTGSKMLLAKTTDEGESWRRTIVNADFLNVYFKDEQNGFINSSNFIYTTNNGGYTLDTLETFPYEEILYMDAMKFIDSLTGFIGVSRPKIYKSVDGGENWHLTNITGLTDTIGPIIRFFFPTSLTVWAIKSKQIMKTTDGGENWFVQTTSPGGGNFTSIHFVDSLNGWASILGRKPLKTTDGGNNWIEQTQLTTNFSRDIFFVDNLNGFIVESNELYQTTDGGNTFFLNTSVSGFGFGRFSNYYSENIFITGNKVYRSINSGMTWIDFPEVQGKSLIHLNLLNVMSGYAVGNIGLIYKYYDESVPAELTMFSAELSDNSILLKWETAAEINNRGFEIQRKEPGDSDWMNIGLIVGKGTTTEISSYSFMDIPKTNGTYEYRLKQIDFDGTFTFSNIIKVDYSIREFKLYQNYPNPFNPKTIIDFSIPEKCSVVLAVYDVTGSLIRQLVNDVIDSGNYSIELNSSSLSSGVYFYSMRTSTGYNSTKKLIIIK